MLIVLVAAYLRVEELHNFDNGLGLIGSFLPVGDVLEFTDHFLYVSSVFVHPESVTGGVVFQFDFFHAPKIMKFVRIPLSLCP